MCTVSYIPKKISGGFVLTSNRDEKSYRATIPPQIYNEGDTKVCFPKDKKAGGSWIAANNSGRLCCLLNGAFEAHQKKSFYAESRGKILTELTSSDLTPFDFFQQKTLTKVEPFTIITVENKKEQIVAFSEFVWDGNTPRFRELNPNEPYIWSSVTLYNLEQRKLRKQWFAQFLKKINGSLSPENIFDFHSGKHTADNSVNVVMERAGDLKTVSITQVIADDNKFRMKYFDLFNSVRTEVLV